ncbi:MAG: efflux RND transporter periplasmic adaptor subunit [Roseateles depolymerans]|uniref:Efflux RND transporter periplasmic adaptor subunit n=1 Tax=Roseateles depolymerans TaxID=76731 RepID=A0A2W5DDI7_9BURK|nr:MAG: efflux RND transporter periplasmic adaptor subunit [Roseateles depolymerans]
MKKTWKIGVLAAAVLTAGGAGFAVMASKGEPAKAGGDKPATVLEFQPAEVVRPAMAAMPAVIEFSGPLVAPGTVVVRSKANGTLLSLAVGEGSRVHAGQALGQLDLEELRHKVAERSAGMEAMRAQMEQAGRTHKANEGLAAQSFIAPTALDNSRAAYDAARANWQAARAQLETMQVGLRQAALVSPINGVVYKRHALPGEKLAAEQQILTIVDLARLELAGLVGTHEVSRLAPGMPVQVQVEGMDQTVQAHISRIAPAAEPGTRSICVTLVLDNPRELYRAGQYAVARVVLDDDKQRLTLPLSAISRNAGQEQVWMIEKGELVRRIVTTGRSDERGGRVEILKGLTPAAQVLAARFDNLREGDKAAVATPRSAAASAPQLASASAPLAQ